MKRNLKLILAAIAPLGLIACGGAQERQTGALDVSISGPSSGGERGSTQLRSTFEIIGTANAAALIKSVSVQIVGADGSWYGPGCITTDGQPITFPLQARQDGLVAGNYTVQATAYSAICNQQNDATNQVFSQTVNATVAPRERTNVQLVMQQKVNPQTINVTAPFIRGIAITGTPPAIGAPVHLVATVDAPPTSSFQWQVYCGHWEGSSVFSAPTATATDLTLFDCASEATVVFSVTAPSRPEANGSLTAAVSFTLGYVAQGLVADISLNSLPNINYIDGTLGNVVRLPGGDPIHLIASVTDPEGDNFTPVWSDNCSGRFVAYDLVNWLDVLWYAPSTAIPGTECTLTLTVTESGNETGHNGGSNSATFTLMIAPTIVP